MLLYPIRIVALMRLFLATLRAAVLVRKGDSQPLHFSEQSALMDAEFSGRSQAVIGVFLQRLLDGLDFQKIAGHLYVGVGNPG